MSFAEVPYHKLSILVVEDETHTRTIIKSLLRQLGIRTIVEAANGRDGLIEVEREEPHLVLCDVHMKPIDGREFLKTLRGLPNATIKDTPVVFLTADANRDTVLFAKEHAISGYLVKPPSAATLKARIDAIAVTLKL
jgi:two-component system chemotaxis response regulator CheY